MKTGISTASFFVRKNTEDALSLISENKVEIAEVFLSSYSEYEKAFGDILASRKGETKVHSFHTLTTQFEPQLYSINTRAKDDAFIMLNKALEVAKCIDAKYYTFHGVARLKKTPLKINFDRVGQITNEICDLCEQKGIELSYENVHWAYYNYVGFFSELKKRVPRLKGVLDIKQARQSNIDSFDLIKEMNKDIVTVHLSDIDCDGKMCLPSRGITDFDLLIKKLIDVGFDGALILEVYKEDYKETSELFDCVNYIKYIAEKYSK